MAPLRYSLCGDGCCYRDETNEAAQIHYGGYAPNGSSEPKITNVELYKAKWQWSCRKQQQL